MGPDRLDKFIKKQVEHHKTPTDPELLWQKIQAKQNVEEKPKRRFLFFWLLGGLLLISIAVGFYIYKLNNSDDNKLVQTESNLNDKLVISSEAGEEEIIIPSEVEEEKPLIPSEVKEDKVAIPGEARETTTENNIIQSTQSNSAASNQTTDLIDKRNTSASNKNAASKKQSNTDTTPTSNKMESGIISPPNSNQQQAVTGENQNESSTVKTNGENASQSSDLTNKVFTKSETLKTVTILSLIDEPIVGILFVDKQNPTDSKKEFVFKNEKAWSLSNGFAFSYGFAPRTTSSADDTLSQDYLKVRNDMETSLDAVRLNLDLMLQHKSGFYTKTGLEYEQINERFNSYVEWDSIVIDPNQVVAVVYPMSGNSFFRRDSAELATVFWVKKKIFNRYHSIDIPLLIGYNSTKENKKLGWFVEGGVSMNVWFKARGEILDESGESIRLENNDHLFKARTGFSLLGTIGLSYHLTDHFSVWGSPTIKYHLSSISSNENPIDQKYLNTGLQVGIRYHWLK